MDHFHVYCVSLPVANMFHIASIGTMLYIYNYVSTKYYKCEFIIVMMCYSMLNFILPFSQYFTEEYNK